LRNGANGADGSIDQTLIQKYTYGNCLFMANDCIRYFKHHLRKNGLGGYAAHVELATDNFKQKAKSSREYHCVAMLRLPDFCIVLDPVAHGYAIKVPLGGIAAGGTCGFQFAYFTPPEPPDARILVWYGMPENEAYNVLDHPAPKGKFTYNDLFMPITDGIAGGIEKLAWPSDSYIDKLPSRRCVWMRQIWDKKPAENMNAFAMEDGSGRRVVETARIFFDLRERQICLEFIPYGDWLAQAEQAYFLRRLRNRNGFQLQNGTYDRRDPEPTMVYYQLDLGTPRGKFSANVQKSLEFCNELVEALGMPEGEFLRMTEVMLEAWEEDRGQLKTGKKGKRGSEDATYHS
ncbi:hypothetical protein EK21DRAFT_72846, partial [Setomelanomma holmii]